MAEFGYIFQDDLLLACQWADLHRHHSSSGEHRLALAILRDALLCIVRPTGIKPGPRANRRIDALLWLRGAKDCHVTFEYICEALSIDDAEGFRERLIAYVERFEAKSDKPSLEHMKLERM